MIRLEGKGHLRRIPQVQWEKQGKQMISTNCNCCCRWWSQFIVEVWKDRQIRGKHRCYQMAKVGDLGKCASVHWQWAMNVPIEMQWSKLLLPLRTAVSLKRGVLVARWHYEQRATVGPQSVAILTIAIDTVNLTASFWQPNKSRSTSWCFPSLFIPIFQRYTHWTADQSVASRPIK